MVAVKNFRVDSFVADLAIKAPCIINSIVNLTLSGEQTVNDLAVLVGDRVLVMAQTDPIENGIYNVETSAWQRSGDFDGSRDATRGTLVTVNVASGDDDIYQLNSTNPIVIGTDSIVFARVGDPVTATTAQLADILDAINTGPRKEAGYMVFNSTTGLPVWAAGDADDSLWVDATGATAHSPGFIVLPGAGSLTLAGQLPTAVT